MHGLLAFLLSLTGHANHPAPPGPATCLPDITVAERQFALPPKLLNTIGIVESGRADPHGRVAPWPWTINVAGIGHVFATKADAIRSVEAFQRLGVRSIDVGCMQVNLLHHPNAFASLDEAFDPRANTQYGARFLRALYAETGNWPQAAALYHSRTPPLGVAYELRVMAIWPFAGRYPDAALNRAGPLPDEDLSRFTPEFAEHLKQSHADLVRLATPSVAAGRPPKAVDPELARYTPAFAAHLKELRDDQARMRAEHATPDDPPGRPAHHMPRMQFAKRG